MNTALSGTDSGKTRKNSTAGSHAPSAGVKNSEANGTAESAVVTTVAPDQEQSSTEVEIRADTVEIRIQGREYNYQNVSYGNTEHTLEELLIALNELPRDTRIVLAVEDDATKNAVDALEQALAEAGFTDVRK